MSTRTDTTLQPSNSTDALFRAWVQFIHDTLITTGGWVDPGDSGQMTIASASHPTIANTKTGYRIYRMADSLQSTNPVFMRLDFGSSASANTPGIWITVGQGSDSAGNITSVRYNGGASANPVIASSSNATGTTNNSYGSADTGRVQIALCVDGTIGHGLTFSLERTRDATGALTGDGLIFMGIDPNIGTGVCHGRIIVLSSGAQPPVEKGLAYCLSNNSPSAFGSDVGIAIPIPFKGVAQPPGLGYTLSRAADYVAEAQYTVTIYGTSHTYQHLNIMQASNANSGSAAIDTNTRVAMLYE
jgi:hypothetical protein